MTTSQKIATTIAIALTLGICSIIIIRWNAWFGNPTEDTYEAPAKQDRIILSFTPDGQKISISWRYGGHSTKNFVEYFEVHTKDTSTINASCVTISTQGGTQNHYRAILPNFTYNTSYAYRLVNDSNISDWYIFKTGNPSKTIDFILLGDIQDEAGGPSAQLFQDIALRYPHADFWVFVGDMVERPTDYYWNVLFDALLPYAAQFPIIACPGNHEHRKGMKKQLDNRWEWMFGHPQLPQSTDFSIDLPLLHIASIKTDGLFWPWDYWGKRRQLTNQHVLSATSPQQWNILLMHHPIYPGSIGRHNLMFRSTFKPFIERNGIHLVLTGHDHCYARRTSSEGKTFTTPIYILTNSSSKYYLSNCDTKAEKIACGIRLYSHVHLSTDTMFIKTYTAEEHQLYDEIECVRTFDSIHVTDKGSNYTEKILLPESFQKDSKTHIRKKFQKKKSIRESIK